MAVEREKGYEFRGWKLGEKVRLKRNGKEYMIIGFDESMMDHKFIVIDNKGWSNNIKDSQCVTSYIDTKINGFEWVKESEIEKIEDTTLEKLKQYDFERTSEKQEQMKVLYDEEAVEFILNNYKRNIIGTHNIEDNTFIYLIDGIKCVLSKEYGCSLFTEFKEKEKEKVLEKISEYETHGIKEEVKKADKNANESRHIKPDYYKINVAGTECEVKDVIKATVKDYDSVLIANIIKYVMRYRGKNGLEDLKKARTYLDELIGIMEGKHE